MQRKKSAPFIQYSTNPVGKLVEQESVKSRLSQITLWSAFWCLLLFGSVAFGSSSISYSDVFSQLMSGQVLNASSADGSSKASAQSESENPQAKISRFCIFGVDDVKLRPSAARDKTQPRRVDSNENGDCWIDKPGQMA